MKIKNKALLFSILISNYFYTETPSELSAQIIQETMHPTTTQPSDLINFNNAFESYIQEQYNHPNYSEYISQNGTDFLTLLETIKDYDLGDEKIFKTYTIFKLFKDKMNNCSLIDDVIISQIISKTPSLIDQYFKKDLLPSLEETKTFIEYQLQLKLLEHFEQFAADPTRCVTTVSEQLAKQIVEKHKSLVEQIDRTNKLRSMIIRFFETMISKTIWDIRHPENLWLSISAIANGTTNLLNTGILDDEDDVDSIIWILVHRFCFFLDLRGSFLPLNFYDEIEEALNNGSVKFLEEEQDDFITTKKEVLIEALTKAKIKAIAFYQGGIISDEITQ